MQIQPVRPESWDSVLISHAQPGGSRQGEAESEQGLKSLLNG